MTRWRRITGGITLQCRRSQFAVVDFKVTSGEYTERCLEAAAKKITYDYDGDKKVEATDDTFKDAAKVGLWTEAELVDYFDDLNVTAR